MRNNSDSCRCLIFLLVTVIIAGLFCAWVSVAFIAGNIPNIVTAAWVAFGLGVLFLILLFAVNLAAAIYHNRVLTRCMCCYSPFLLAGIFGTILPALFALANVITPVIPVAVAFVVIGSFFFAVMITSVIGLLSCIKRTLCCLRNENE